MGKDVREFIRQLEAAGLTVESTPGHYNVLRDGKPLQKANGLPFRGVVSWPRAGPKSLSHFHQTATATHFETSTPDYC
jgi:hypothetical protein